MQVLYDMILNYTFVMKIEDIFIKKLVNERKKIQVIDVTQSKFR